MHMGEMAMRFLNVVSFRVSGEKSIDIVYDLFINHLTLSDKTHLKKPFIFNPTQIFRIQ